MDIILVMVLCIVVYKGTSNIDKFGNVLGIKK